MRKLVGYRASCDSCGSTLSGVRLMEKLDPRTFRPDRRRLCPPCGRRDGWVAVTFGRGSNGAER